MIYRTVEEARLQGRQIVSPDGKWDSIRLLLKDDKMGFSFHITTIYEGMECALHYQNHLESVYCISGEGEVENCADGAVYSIKPGSIYVLDKNDKHILRAHKELLLACVFNPPLIGKEVHNKDGAYELIAETID
ncbi:MAG: ectoine synthase [Reinekea sp.]